MHRAEGSLWKHAGRAGGGDQPSAMTGLLEQLMELPTLPEFVAELDTRLAAERDRRRQSA